MTDNFPFDPGTTDIAAANNIGGVLYPRVKVTLGSAGNANADLDGDSTNGAWVNVKAMPSIPAGTNVIGKVGIDHTTPGTTDTVLATTSGDTAAAATDAGNPVKIGGVGKTTNPTAVTDGQRANALFDKLGKQVVVGAIRDLKGQQQTTITSSTSETTIATAVASTFLDLYGLVITNTSATVCAVTVKDATSGTTRFVFEVPPNDTRGFMLPVDSAVPQAVVNNNWTATCGTSVASIQITALFVKNL